MGASHTRSLDALALHDGRRGAVAMGAQHPAGRGAPLFHHLPDDEAGLTGRPNKKNAKTTPCTVQRPCRCEALPPGRNRLTPRGKTAAPRKGPRPGELAFQFAFTC